jgi:hypothetical protein
LSVKVLSYKNDIEEVKMEEVKEQAGLQTEQPAEVKEEFRITEDGLIEGDFSDWGLPADENQGEQPSGEQGEEGQGQEQQQAQQQQAQQGQEQQQGDRYTPEQIKELGLDKLDPNKLPPELVPFYKSMQADYTRKTQALAEERKLIERVLDKVVGHPELAKQVAEVQEFNALLQKHPDLAVKFQSVIQQQQKNPIDELVEQAKRLTEQELGEEFDEFNPKHLAVYTLKITELQNQMARQQQILSKIEQLKASEPNFAEIDNYASQKIMQMPYGEALKIINAIQTGDLDTLMQFWEECRKEWYQQHLNQTQSQPQPQPQKQPKQPPPVEGAGQGNVENNIRFDPEKFASMDEEEQARYLVKLGLVE